MTRQPALMDPRTALRTPPSEPTVRSELTVAGAVRRIPSPADTSHSCSQPNGKSYTRSPPVGVNQRLAGHAPAGRDRHQEIPYEKHETG